MAAYYLQEASYEFRNEIYRVRSEIDNYWGQYDKKQISQIQIAFKILIRQLPEVPQFDTELHCAFNYGFYFQCTYQIKKYGTNREIVVKQLII